jgi:hypothetical protein
MNEPRTLREEIEECLITWVHARCDIEELQRQHTPGAMIALLLTFRITVLGEDTRALIDSLEKDIEAGTVDARPVVEAINLAVKGRRACLGYDDEPGSAVQDLEEDSEEDEDEGGRAALWFLSASLGSYLEMVWFGRRASDRLLRMQPSRGSTLATWLVQRLYTAGEPLAEVMKTVADEDLPELFAALDRALTDYPDRQAKRLGHP